MQETGSTSAADGPSAASTSRRPTVIDQMPTTIGVADSDLCGLPLDGVNKALGLMKAVGVDTVRILIPWVAVQDGKDGYDWSLVDRMVDAAVSNRLSILATLNSPPAWAVAPGQQPVAGRPAAPATFGRFAGAVAAHFRGRIAAYEIWNEPNAAAFFAPAPDPAGFVDLLRGRLSGREGRGPGGHRRHRRTRADHRLLDGHHGLRQVRPRDVRRRERSASSTRWATTRTSTR